MNLAECRWPHGPTTHEAALISSVAHSRTWTDGGWTAEVERRLADRVGAPYAIAFNSCASALHAALHAMDATSETRIVAPSLTVASTLTGAWHIGARIGFEDVHPDLLTLVGESEASSDSDIVIGVDLHGVPHQMRRDAIARPAVLTDACQALGAEIGGKHVGAKGTHAWSFSSVEIVAAPDGGAVTTDDSTLAERLRELRGYGVRQGRTRSKDAVVWPGGHDWRPSELSMVMVAERLNNLDRWLGRARAVADRLHRTMDRVGMWRQRAPVDTAPSWHKVRFGTADMSGAGSLVLERRLADAGVPTRRWGQLPLHQHPVAGRSDPCELPITDAAASGTLCLGTESCPPMTWNDDEVEQVCRVLEAVAES